MDKLRDFCFGIKNTIGEADTMSVSDARRVVRSINDFLYTNYPGIGSTFELGEYREYFSDFHKFWEAHHKEILDCKISDGKCEQVADALHSVYAKTEGGAFREIWDTCGLAKEDVCRIRFLTANQDFRGSLDFSGLARIFRADPSIFDKEIINDDPADFISKIGISAQSQNDKRISYAKNISRFLIDRDCDPYELIDLYQRDLSRLRKDLLDCEGSGYGNKKTDMMLRDMVVLGIWNDVEGFDKIDVASDVNTIKVALRTGIIQTAIPLVSSFMDIFCHQYAYIETMNAQAWRRVWEIWMERHPEDNIASPCLIDFFVYNVVGKQFCRQNLFVFECETGQHTFRWHSARNRKCQYCYRHGVKTMTAHIIGHKMACQDAEGYVAIMASDYVSRLPEQQKFTKCPFAEICSDNKNLQPPKSISILGKTGWTQAYARKGDGGGGIMG